jgi:hypothetical protein
MLKIVAYQEQLLLTKRRKQLRGQRLVGLQAYAEALSKAGEEQRAIDECSERHIDNTVAKGIGEIDRKLERESRFANATRSGEREQAYVGA